MGVSVGIARHLQYEAAFHLYLSDVHTSTAAVPMNRVWLQEQELCRMADPPQDPLFRWCHEALVSHH